jgi:hypothetical protein
LRLWNAVKAAASGVEDDGTYDSPHSADNCAARRAAAFKVTANDLGLPANWGSKPFGVVVEALGPRGVSTLTAFANGDASLLLENGSGIIGRQNHVHVVNQAKRLVERAADFSSRLSPTVNLSRPEPGSMRLYFLTTSGLRSTELAQPEVRSAGDPWSPLISLADELVSEFSQYLLTDVDPAGSPQPVEFLRSLAMVAVIGGLTYAASLIPIPWIRWPLVGIGLFFTAAALFVFYLMLAGGRDGADEEDAATGR